MPRALILLFTVLVLLAIAGLSAQESAPTPTATERPAEDLSREELLDRLATSEAGRATEAAGRATERDRFFTNVLRYFRAGGEPSSKYPLNTLTREELLELLAGESARANAAQARAEAATARANAELERFIWFEVIRLKLEGELSEDLPLPPDPTTRPTVTPIPQLSPSSTPASPTATPSWDHLSWEELLARLASEARRAEVESERAKVWSARAEAETARAEDVREHLDAAEQAVAALRAALTATPTPTPAAAR